MNTAKKNGRMRSEKSDTSSSHSTGHSSIRSASRIDIPALAALLGKSLANDPLLRWIFPDESRRRNGVGRYFGRLLKPRIRNGVVSTIDCKSVAVWTPPNLPLQTLVERYRESFYMRYTHGRRVHRVRDCLQRMAKRHPPFPHWYLLALATDDACRGQGLAGRLLEEMLHRCDRKSEKIALETSKESNLAFYEKFGFVVTDELLIDKNVKTWLMVR